MRPGGAALCPGLRRSSEKPYEWGGNFGRAGMKPVFHTADESLCISYSFSPRTSPWSKKLPCGVLEKANGSWLQLPEEGAGGAS